MIKKITVLLMLFALAAVPAFAAEGTYSDQALAKAKTGLTNTLFGWTELLTEPYEGAKGGGLTGAITGTGAGIVNTVGDTVGGVVQLVTAPVPQIEVPLPEGGTDLFKS